MNSIREVSWKEKSQVVDSLIEFSDSLTVVPLDSGLEAEVVRIYLDETSFVMKIWNRSSKPNVASQYKLLKVLFNQGLPVSQPLGWGFNQDENQVLLTSFDGSPLKKLTQSDLIDLTKILSDIHRFPLQELEESILHTYEFIHYFYPRIEEHKDLKTLLHRLVDMSDIKQDRLIHGDFNLGNIVESDEKYTVIDWTNGQLGDPRYDIAWSTILIKIYVGQRHGIMYRSAFLSDNPYTIDELELFEAIACLRWILLYRTADLPRGKETITRVRNILKNNKHLNENLI